MFKNKLKDKSIILFVNTNPPDFKTIKKILDKNDYLIKSINKTKELFTHINKETPDLILLDMKESDFDGEQLIKEIQNQDEAKEIPVILLTEKLKPENTQINLVPGVIDYIIMPFNPVDFLTRVNTLLALKKARDMEKELYLRLNQRNKDLEQIIHIVSHDLRNPMTNIQGFTTEIDNSLKKIQKIIKNTMISGAVRKELDGIIDNEIGVYKKFIKSSILNMDNLLAGLLRLSRMGRGAVEMGRINTKEIIHQALTSMEYIIKEKKIKVEVKKCPDCFGDAVHIAQLFSNLIDNAVKYSDPDKDNKSIVIAGEKIGHKVIYSIMDNGIGIDSKFHHKIFDVFHRLNPDTSEGEGLGLTIVQKILDMHEGRIWVESEAGLGSTFYIELPGH